MSEKFFDDPLRCSMAKKKTEPTFRDLLDVAESRINDLRAKYDERKFIANLIWNGFRASYSIALERQFYQAFGSDLAMVLAHHDAYTQLTNVTEFWKQWPTKMTVFGMYQFEGSSALDVGRRFMESIYVSALAARVFEFESFDSDGFVQPQLERWAMATAKELERAISLTIWPRGVMRRDFAVLSDRAEKELGQPSHKLLEPPVAEQTITIASILKIIVDAESEIATSHKTVSDWSANWSSLDPPGTRNRRFLWADVQTWILEHKQFNIGEFRNLKKK